MNEKKLPFSKQEVRDQLKRIEPLVPPTERPTTRTQADLSGEKSNEIFFAALDLNRTLGKEVQYDATVGEGLVVGQEIPNELKLEQGQIYLVEEKELL